MLVNEVFYKRVMFHLAPSLRGVAGGIGGRRPGAAVTSLERVKITFRERLAYLSLANLTLVSERDVHVCVVWQHICLCVRQLFSCLQHVFYYIFFSQHKGVKNTELHRYTNKLFVVK